MGVCTMTTAWVLGALLLHAVVAAASAGHLANSGCFMQMEDDYLTFVLVPTPNIVNGAHTWHAVNSESGEYLAGHWIYWGSIFSTWSVGVDPDPEALLQAPEGESPYNQSTSCFLDFTVVVNINKAMERTGIVMRLEAPLWTTCAPRQGSPVIGEFDRKVNLHNPALTFAPKSHRDCVKAALYNVKKIDLILKSVIYDRVHRTCEGIVHEGVSYEYVPAPLETTKDLISCAFKCLPLSGFPYFNGSPATLEEFRGRAGSLEDLDEELNLVRSNAVGAYFSSGPFTAYVSNINNALLTDPTSSETVHDKFCFRPMNFNFGCYFLAVDTAQEAECNTVYYKDSYDSFRHYSFTQNKNTQHATEWSSSKSDTPYLKYSQSPAQLICTTSKGATETVTFRCLGDKHICLNDRKRGAAVDYQKPVHPVEDIPGLCPAYRSLVWGNGVEEDLGVLHEAGSLTSSYPYLIGTSKFLQWKQNFFESCDNEGYDEEGRVKCHSIPANRQKHQMVCTEAGHYCMYLTVTEVDTTNGNCIGNFRQLRDRVWVKFEMVTDNFSYSLEDTDVTLTLERVEGSGDGLILECRKGPHWVSRVHVLADRCLAENEYCFDRSFYPAKNLESLFVSIPSGHCEGEMQRYVPDGADQDGAVFYRRLIVGVGPQSRYGTQFVANYPNKYRLKRYDTANGFKFNCVHTSSSNKVEVVEENVKVQYLGSNHVCVPRNKGYACQYVHIRDAGAGECNGTYRKIGEGLWVKFAVRPETGEFDDLSVLLRRVGTSTTADSFITHCTFRDVLFKLEVKCAAEDAETFCLDGST